MGAKSLLCLSTILLILTVNLAYGGAGDNDRSNEDDYDRRSKDKNYDGGMEGYHKDDKQVIGQNGIDPRERGADIGDFGPIYGKGGRPMYSSLNIWISAAEDWEQNRSGRYGGKGSKYGKNKKYNRKNNNGDYKNDGYKNDDYKKDDYKNDDYKKDDYKNDDYKKDDYKNDDYKKDDYKNDDYKKDDYKNDDYKGNDYGGQRRKRSYKKINFPVKQVKNYRKFPFSLFPPLISIAPWVPIFYDKLTYQTFIFSLEGGLIIIPPLINFYGQRFAVAQLIKWGYASLVSSGAPPPPAVNVAPLIQPGVPAVGPGVPAGGPGAPAGGPAKNPAPTYNSKTNQFNGPVKTDFPAFRPRPSYLQDGYNNSPPPANSPKYSN